MEYVEKMLGIKVKHLGSPSNMYPNFISSRYDLRLISMNSTNAIFAYPKTEIEQIDSLKKHLYLIQKQEKQPAVLFLNSLTFNQREHLIREKIPFIVDGKQIYLPFMGTFLQERCDAEKNNCDCITPSAQVLFLYFIYSGLKEMPFSKAAKDLDLTPMSISRAARCLNEIGLLKLKTIGKQKFLYSNESREKLFDKSKEKLLNPIKRTVYVKKALIKDDLLEAGYLALSRYSSICEPKVCCYASNDIGAWESKSTRALFDPNEQTAIQMWRYDPHKISKGKTVDSLSLVLALADDEDERVQGALEEIQNELWKEIDG